MYDVDIGVVILNSERNAVEIRVTRGGGDNGKVSIPTEVLLI